MSKKDWRNFEARREAAIKSGIKPGTSVTPSNYMQNIQQHPPPQAHYSKAKGYSNYGYEDNNDGYNQNQQQPYYNDNYSPHNEYGYNRSASGVSAYSDFQAGKPEIDNYYEDESVEENFIGFKKKRKCRDIIFLGLFFGFVISLVVMVGYCWANENFTQFLNWDDLDINCTVIPKIDTVCEEGRCHSSSTNYTYAIDKDVKIDIPVVSDSKTFYHEVVDDFEKTWVQIIYMTLIALGFALLMTVFLRFFAGIIIWIVVGLIVLFAIGGTIALWILWGTKEDNENGTKTLLLVAAIVVSIIALIVLLVLFGMRKRIKLVIQLFKEAGKAIHSMPFILLQPIWTFLATVILISSWFAVLILIESAGEIKQKVGGSIPTCTIEKDKFIFFSRWWNLLALFWLSQFVIGCQHVVIAGAISTWFFTRNKSKVYFPVTRSFYRLIRYHLGSVALGSLIIAILKLIRAILNYIYTKLGNANVCCKALLCCCKCMVWCLESFLNFLNRNAYIEIAIYGYGFCSAAKKAFKVICNNALRLMAINSIGDLVLFLTKLIIVIVTIVIGYYIIKDKEGEIHHIWIPLFIAAIFSYFIAHCFITVYEMAIDTIFVCFCEDIEMNSGDENSPYYMSKGLMIFVKENKKLEAKEKKKNK